MYSTSLRISKAIERFFLKKHRIDENKLGKNKNQLLYRLSVSEILLRKRAWQAIVEIAEKLEIKLETSNLARIF